MNPCLDCPLEDNLDYCCHSNPETGEQIERKIQGDYYLACPNLNKKGMCSIYDDRPEACREYQCHKFSELELFDLFN